jgi:hypothetical protein
MWEWVARHFDEGQITLNGYLVQSAMIAGNSSIVKFPVRGDEAVAKSTARNPVRIHLGDVYSCGAIHMFADFLAKPS